MQPTHYRTDGTPERGVVLFCPALGTTLEVWEPQVRSLSARVRSLRYDLPGHGGSVAVADGTTIAALGRQALEVLDSQGIERATVAGLSLGGMVGLWLARHAPHRLNSLVLCSTAAWLGPKERWIERATLVRAKGLGLVAETVLQRWVDLDDPDIPAGVENRCWRMLAAITPEGFAACSEAVADFDARDDLAGIKTPTTILVAENDAATTAGDARLLASAIPDARLTVLPGRSHLLTLARPAEVTDAVWQAVTEAL